MESQDNQKLHPSGHENHGGTHVCHRCGWAFPNPHPSAKQRRAHKKHCGKIQGFKLIDADEKTHADEDHSDEDHLKKPVEELVKNLKMEEEKEEKESSETIEKGSGGVSSEAQGSFGSGGDGFSSSYTSSVEVQGLSNDVALEASNVDENLDSNNLAHGVQVQGPDEESVAVQFENGTQLHIHEPLTTTATDVSTLNASTDTDRLAAKLTEQEEGSACSLLTKASLADCSVEKTDSTAAQNVVDSSNIVTDTDVGCYGENEIGLDNMEILPGDPASDASEIDSDLHKMEEYVEINLPLDLTNASGTLTRGFPDEASANTKELKSNCSHPQDEQTDAARQVPQNELFFSTGSGHVEVDAGERLDASADSAQVNYQSGMAENCKVKENVDENSADLSLPLSTTLGGISEMKHGLCKDHGSVGTNVSLISAGPEVGMEPEYHHEDPVPEVVQTKLISVQSEEGADLFPSVMQLQENNPPYDYEKNGNISAIRELNDNHSDKERHNNGEHFPFIKDFECETDASAAKCAVVEGLESDGLKADTHATITESLGAQADASDLPITGACGVDVLATHLQEAETEGPFVEHEAYHDLSNGVLPGSQMVVEDGGCVAVCDAISQANEATEIDSGHQDAIHEESQVHYNDVVEGHREEVSNEESSWSNTKVYPEPTSVVLEAKPPSNENLFKNELKKDQELTASALGSVVGSEGLDINSGHLENISEPHPDKLDHQKEVLQERSTELAVGNYADLPVTQTEIQIEHTKTESSFSKQPHEEPHLNESNEAGLCYHDTHSVTLEGSNTNDFSRGISDHPFQEEGNLAIPKVQPDAALVATDASVDSNSQTDSVEGQWGSVSDGTVPSRRHATMSILGTEAVPAIDTQSPKDLNAVNLAVEGAFVGNSVNDMDLSEASPFMTLVEPGKQTDSNEIQSVQSPPVSHTVQESQGRKKNEEIIAKVVNWSSGKPHTPLKSLLVEASKQKAPNAHDHNMSLSTSKEQALQAEGHTPKAPTSKMASENSNRVDQKEWNSPARLPISKNEKRRVKGKPTWVPFMCCSSVN